MKIPGITSGGSSGISKNAPIVSSGSNASVEGRKSLGETPPVRLDLATIGRLAAHFQAGGLVDRIRKRLNLLKNKKCQVVPAKGTTACIDDKELVYLGVEFLAQYENDPETLAGVLAHEWGHACAQRPTSDEIQELNWDEIFELRRAHETLADEICGRLLFLMGYSPEGVIQFLQKGKETHNLKYHSPDVRGQIVRYGFESEKRKAQLARQLFPSGTYSNNYSSSLLDIV